MKFVITTVPAIIAGASVYHLFRDHHPGLAVLAAIIALAGEILLIREIYEI